MPSHELVDHIGKMPLIRLKAASSATGCEILGKPEFMNPGGSSGINVAGAIRLARELGPGHTIVTILCDSGLRYQSRLFNREFLESKGLSLPDWYSRSA